MSSKPNDKMKKSHKTPPKRGKQYPEAKKNLVEQGQSAQQETQDFDEEDFQRCLNELNFSSEKSNVPKSENLQPGESQSRKNASNSFPLWITIIFLIGIVSTITLVLIVFLIFTGVDPWILLWEHKLKLILGYLVTTIGGTILKEFGPKKRESVNPTHTNPANMAAPGEDWLHSTGYILKAVGMWLFQNRLVRAITVIVFIFVISCGFCHAVYKGSLVRATKSVAETEPQFNESGESELDPKVNHDSVIEDSTEESNGLPEENNPEFLREPDRIYTLSEEDEGRLFFRTGDYAIPEGTSASEIADRIKPFIQQLLEEQLENGFDLYAPENIKGEIANASRLEERMTNSDELDQVIATRMDVWPDYPKYRIAKLLANNMQTYAKEYTKINGNYETIKYYHAQSIFWTWKSLTFASVTSYTLKNDLDYIRMRYHDIADKAALGSEDQLRASTLSEAFMILENMEFSFEDEAFPETSVENRDISDSDMILENGEAFEYE